VRWCCGEGTTFLARSAVSEDGRRDRALLNRFDPVSHVNRSASHTGFT